MNPYKGEQCCDLKIERFFALVLYVVDCVFIAIRCLTFGIGKKFQRTVVRFFPLFLLCFSSFYLSEKYFERFAFRNEISVGLNVFVLFIPMGLVFLFLSLLLARDPSRGARRSFDFIWEGDPILIPNLANNTIRSIHILFACIAFFDCILFALYIFHGSLRGVEGLVVLAALSFLREFSRAIVKPCSSAYKRSVSIGI